MTLENTLLRKLSDGPPGGGPREVSVTDQETQWTAALKAEAIDTVGSRLWEVTLTKPGLALDGPALKAVGEKMAANTTGLLEPLRLLEVDGQRRVAVLRSDSPTEREESLYYYEALVHGDGKTNLRRYEGSREAGSRREQVAFTLTHEALAKLAGDLADAF